MKEERKGKEVKRKYKTIEKPSKKTHKKYEDEFSDIIEEMKDKEDIFDFEKYEKDYKYVGKYFKNELEHQLRTALLIDYLYNHNNEKGRKVVREHLKNSKDPKKALEDLLDVFEVKYLLAAFYKHYAPDKMDKLNAIIKKYGNGPSLMFNFAYRNNVDDTWKDTKLWFASKQDETKTKTTKEKEQKKPVMTNKGQKQISNMIKDWKKSDKTGSYEINYKAKSDDEPYFYYEGAIVDINNENSFTITYDDDQFTQSTKLNLEELTELF